MRFETGPISKIFLVAFLAMALAACQDNNGFGCGFIDLTLDGIRYDVNTCEDLGFRNGCDYTIDYLNLCYEEGGTQYCQELSIAFVTPFAVGEFEIVHPDEFQESSASGNVITGYLGELLEDTSVVPVHHMHSGRLIITEYDVNTGSVTGSFEFAVNMGGENNKVIVANGTFTNVRW